MLPSHCRRSEGVPTLIVGDLKQAIMGFQNADPRLMEALQQEHVNSTRPLVSNWRSTPALMNLINQVGAGLFGDEYTALTPMAQFPSSTKPLELLNVVKGKKIADRIQFTVDRIRRLLADESETIYDKKQGVVRRLLAGDIAVLCPTNARLDTFAAILRENGIRSLIEQEGWYESRIVQLVVNALHYVADPSDRHAALYLCVTELGSHSLESALQALIAGEMPPDPLLDNLQPVVAGTPDRSVETIVEEIISRLALYDLISLWPDAAQARVNLLRLQRESREFMAANQEALASGGFYGSGIKTFLAWLAGRATRENNQPEPQVMDEEAVQLITWHRSKGREWPVVIVSSTDCPVAPRLPECSVVYEDFSDLGSVLDNALIEISPDFVAAETKDIFFDRLLPDALDSAGRLLYVALTRAREKLILEWPEFQAKSNAKSGSYWSLLKSRTHMSLSGAATDEGDELPPVEMESKLPLIGRRAVKPGIEPVDLTPETVSPSSLHDENTGTVKGVETVRYGDALTIKLSVEGMERGALLHRCFELMGENAMSAADLSKLTGYQFCDAELHIISKAAAAFERWLTDRLKPLHIGREVPVLALNTSGSVINGSIDLLVETASGFWIIDHKSDQTDDLELRFAGYLPQLTCYAGALTAAKPDKPLLGVAVNWISNGVISFLNILQEQPS